jgi:hypothetical protein
MAIAGTAAATVNKKFLLCIKISLMQMYWEQHKP